MAGNRTSEQIGTTTNSPAAVSQSSYNNVNQVTSRSASSGPVMFAGTLDKQGSNVTVNGSVAIIQHLTTNFVGYATLNAGSNTVPIIATDYGNHSRTNNYAVVVTNNGVAETLTFDANGNETSVVTPTSTNVYQWDAVNRLVSITGPTNQSVVTYDGFGRRVEIIELTNGVAYLTNKFVWDKAELCEQRSNMGAVTKRFFADGEQISGANYYFTRDHLGSVREMVDSTGAVQTRYDYDPYGRRARILGSLDADFAYAGYYYHAVSGLYLTWLRAYDSDSGRWLSRDPVAEVGGLNLYAYVFGNPINWLDPLGLFSWSAFGRGVVNGVLWGAATAAVAALAVGLGAPIAVVTGVLLGVAAVSVAFTAVKITQDWNNDCALSYDLGSLAGSALFGLRAGRSFNTAMSPPGETSAPGLPGWFDMGKEIKWTQFPSSIPSDIQASFGKGPTLPSGAAAIAATGAGGPIVTRSGSGGDCH